MAFIQHAQCFTALGDERATSRALLEGTIGLKRGPVPHVEADDLVPQAWMPDNYLDAGPRWFGYLQALRDALPDRPWGQREYPIFITSSNYGIDHLFKYSQDADLSLVDWMTPHKLIRKLRTLFGWGSHVTILSHACVTAQLGLLLAERSVEQGVAREALVFSFDFLSPFVIGGFHSLKILNDGMPAPYQDGETGSIGLGEGAGAIVVGSAPTNFRIRQQSIFNEMFHFTANAPDGSGFEEVFSAMSAAAGAGKAWVKGHGTGTLEAGKLEAEAVDRLIPGAPLVSWKGSIGHTLGSCAVVELAIALESIRAGRIPGNLGAKGPYFSKAVQQESFSANDFSSVILSSNAFGGAHAAMLIDYE